MIDYFLTEAVLVQLYVVVGLCVALAGIHSYRDALDNRNAGDAASGIMLFAVLWLPIICVLAALSVIAGMIWCVRKLYEVKINV